MGIRFALTTLAFCVGIHAQTCTNVSVEGDATYCVTGKICGDEGDSCPKKGDTAAANCVSNIKSYTSNGQCVAPADAVCQTIKTGARGCVFKSADDTSSQTTTTPPSTTAPPPTATSTPPSGCTNVSVEGDATYCVTGKICGDEGDSCPKKGDTAAANCVPNIKSYMSNGQCVAPADAVCQTVRTGVRGCLFEAKNDSSTNTPSPSTTKYSSDTTGVPTPSPTSTVSSTDSTPEPTMTPEATTGYPSSTYAPKTTTSSRTTVKPSPNGTNSTVPGTLTPTITTPPSTTLTTPAATNITTPTTSPAPNTTTAPPVCAENWSQCNGQSWPFGVCCKSVGWECVVQNEYYSQCLPPQST